MTTIRKTLLAVAVLGAAATAAGTGTLASFSASTSNSSTFATGSLVLSNQKDAATACLSTGGGTTDTNEHACDSLFALTVQKPGDAATANVTLANEGSLDGSALRAFAAEACDESDAPGEAHHGTGDPCEWLQVYVQEFTTSARTTASACHYGGGTSTTCAYDAAKTLDAFDTAFPDAASGLGLGATTSGTSRHFTIGIRMDPDATNAVQGRQASFGFTWQLAQ